MTGVSECSQQRGNLKDDRYISIIHLTKFQNLCCYHYWYVTKLNFTPG
ncbi:hypothetical protein [Photorhabdus bodei]|uniref:Uncharacterized protein n=1 Tax=Photorhabdus bodei TaxID=2029681 RepID=A0ABX0AQE2_9GAMM|nr:hypothetical protein [Photorhabdus bodei]NDL01041.1 hypothetical protein [Photorhabdus bodei]NDL05290.1 hypothetical protein [Photorhabdus bodei]NDL09544.1 hypothetical protein [Photorhabdus bodei]